MPTIDLRNIERVVAPHFWPLFNNQHRVIVCKGGASSGKSHNMLGLRLIYKMLAEPGHRWLVVRKVAKTLRHSCYDLLCQVIRSWRMESLFRFNKTDMMITCGVNGNEIILAGLDDVEKLKSIVGITDILVEEAPEITEADFNQLDLRLRGPTKYKKQIVLLLNPISAMHWIKARFFDRPEADCITDHSTYLDNPWLDPDTIARLEGITDPYFRSVYVNGEWGVLGNTVFTNFVIENFDIDGLQNVCQGMDFGTVHAAAIERMGFYEGDLYSFDELHGKGWTNSDFIAAADDYFTRPAEKPVEKPVNALRGQLITADSAEPDRIIEFQRAGYRVVPAKKGAGSLRYGIDFLSSHRWHIHATRCPGLAREVPVFKRKEDKDGNVLDSFVEINDDGIAASRYATESIWANTTPSITAPVR